MLSNNEEIVELIQSYEKQSKALKKSILQMAWHMRGGISLDELYELGYSDRIMISELIDEHIEITKDSGMPFF